MAYVIEIKITGEDISPQKTSSRDVANLIASIEQMIASVVSRNNPELGIDENSFVIGLVSISQGSYIIQYQPQMDFEAETTEAYNYIANSITTENYNNLPSRCVEAIINTRIFSRKYHSNVEFWAVNGTKEQLAVVTTKTKIAVENVLISGKTTLYGEVIRVGGENPPTARIRLINGNIISCAIKRRNIAQLLGNRLYERVGIRGIAKWDRRDMSLQEFMIEQVTSYRKSPMDKVLASMYETLGKHYEAIENVHSFVADLRGNDEVE